MAVCCGGFGPRLTRSLGGSLPVDLVRVQAGRFRPPFPFGPPGPIVSHHTLGIWLRPDGDDGHYLVGARADFLGRGPYRARSGPGRGGPARAGAPLRARRDASSPAPRAASSAARGRAGSISRPTATRSSTSSRAGPGLLLASGMSGHAFKLCPALGLGAAELLLDGEVSSFDWTPFRYGRFGPHKRGRAPVARGAGGTGTG